MTASEEIKYYAAVGFGRGLDNPAGLIRRRFVEPGPVDEALQRDFTWQWTPEMIRWEQGELGPDFVEISEDDAEQLIDRFRAKWGAEDAASG